ncbi:hypothetical protein PWE35_09360 [Stenotrophomonas maltophilia]|uniref:hypothetical protein n=1 Tax=Stenotrophomonas maltophilia TaxID=40324 RepID=UPI00237FA62B|nr:hypothetical protein [Stenotrophomonas maltophilia]WDW06030.1 hypothetical protein PWE35_09360 [Stenotrophomonas maltophilia]
MTDEIRDGQEAERLLNHPLLLQAFELIEKDIQDQWLNSPARDVDGREKLHLMTKLLHRLKGQLQSVVENGQIVQRTLEQSRATEMLNHYSQR